MAKESKRLTAPSIPSENFERALAVLKKVKPLAKEYYRLTGRPLGITSEVAECEAARILGLELSAVRQAGFDAIRRTKSGKQRLQIKGRCVQPGAKPSQRLGKIDRKKDNWDGVILVLLDDNFDATVIYEADRADVVAALEAPGSRSRNERGALGVPKFRSIGRKIWSR